MAIIEILKQVLEFGAFHNQEAELTGEKKDEG